MRMPCLLAVLVTVTVVLNQGGASEAAPTQQSNQCRDSSETRAAVVRVYQGEVSRLGCPISRHLGVSNHSLHWERVQPGDVPGQPGNLSLPGRRISAEGEWLWFLPAVAEDTGRYVCVLRNETQFVKMAVGMEVLPRPSEGCVTEAAADPLRVKAPLEESKTLHCPDIQEYLLSHKHLSVAWFHKCNTLPSWSHDRGVKDNSLVIYLMREKYQGNYTCIVTYQSGERTMNFTRVVTVRAGSSSRLDKKPVIYNPDQKYFHMVKLGNDVRLDCSARMHDAELDPQVWWEVDGQRLEQLSDQRIRNEDRCEEDSLQDRTMKSALVIQTFSSLDLQREYICHARNSRGNATQKASLKLEAYAPSVQLGCGLGVVLVLALALFVVYHVFRLELLLLYRARCGHDNSDTDGKEYDVYISYARNSEEEEFVLQTLQMVLESKLGYKVFIFDRDSLPGGTITDETLSCVGRSRCLMVVLSPRYLVRGTQALLELKAGLASMEQGRALRVILVQYQPLARDDWIRELRRARLALAVIRWKGEKSSHLSSRFWKRLQLELPVRRRKTGLAEDCSALPLMIHANKEHTHTESTHTDCTHTLGTHAH